MRRGFYFGQKKWRKRVELYMGIYGNYGFSVYAVVLSAFPVKAFIHFFNSGTG